MEPAGKRRLSLLALIVMMSLYVAVMSVAALHRHWACDSSKSDLGLNHQPIWATLHGRPFYRTQGTSLEDHFEPMILLLAPFLSIWSGAETLLILQVLILASGAIPAYLLARGLLNDEALALSIAAMYLLLPSQESANLADFHTAPLAAPLFLFACYYAYKKRLTGAVIFSLLAMSAREDMGYLVLLIGIYLFFKVSRKWGAALALLGVSYTMIAYNFVIPHYARAAWGRKNPFIVRYAYLMQGENSLFLALLKHPERALKVLLSRERIAYAVGLLAGTGFLPLLGMDLLVLGAPFFLLNALSNYPGTYSGEIYYSTILAPFLVLGTIAGAKRLLSFDGKLLRTGLVAWVLLFSFGYHHLRGFTPLAWGFSFKKVTHHNQELGSFQKLIPKDASLTTNTSLYPHFSDRMTIYSLPTIDDAEYVLIDVTANADMHPVDLRNLYEKALSRGYGIVEAKDGYILLKKGAKGKSLPDEFYDFARVKNPGPEYPATVKFRGGVTFLGLDVLRYREGKLLKLRTYWHVDAEGNRFPQVFVKDGKGNILETVYDPPSPWILWYPPEMWKHGEDIVIETLPWDLGRYFVVEVGVSDGKDWKDIGKRETIEKVESSWDVPTFSGNTSAQVIAIERRRSPYCKVLPLDRCVPRRFLLPIAVDHKVGSIFGGKVELVGYSVKRKSDHLEVSLYWKPKAQLVKDYSSFVHLIDAEGRMVAQHDGAPRWYTPMGTSSWVPGEIYRDDHLLEIPRGSANGKYHLEIGMYYWKDLKHLDVNGREAIRLPIDLGR